jgi:ZIP family zinc transporter
MAEAFGWGLLAASSLLVGALLAIVVPIGNRLLGLVMAFGAGVLISAVAYELVEDAFETSNGGSGVGWGLFAGAVVFFTGDSLIDRMGGAKRKRSAGSDGGSALAIVLGTVLDGIPESVVIGLSILVDGEVGIAVLAAVFLSNLPEAVAATAGLRTDGWRRPHIIGLWTVVALVSAAASLAGYAFFDGASPNVIAFINAFAAGAILTMLADTMMPEAFEHGGKLVGLMTTLGFATAFALSTLE